MPTTIPLITEPSCRFPDVKDSSSIAAKSSRDGVAVAVWAMNSPASGRRLELGCSERTGQRPRKTFDTAAKRRAGAMMPFERNDDCFVQKDVSKASGRGDGAGCSSNDEGRLSRPSARSDGLDNIDGGPDGAGSISKSVVSSKTASLACFSGATGRFMSRSSRDLISASTAPSSTASPRPRSSRIRRRARSSGVAVTKILTSAFGAITVPMSRPSMTAPGFERANACCRAIRAARTSRNGRDDRGGLRHLVGFQVVLREAGRIVGLPQQRWRQPGLRACRPAAPRGRRRDTAGRCRDAGTRNGPARRLAMVPLPEAAGPSMAIITTTPHPARASIRQSPESWSR